MTKVHLGVSTRCPATGTAYSINSACAAFVRFGHQKLVTMEVAKVTCKSCLKSAARRAERLGEIAPAFQSQMNRLVSGED